MTASPHSVAIKAFCAFVAKTGDLDLRFTPVPTAEEGMAGHRAVAAGRGGDYRSEVAVQGEIEGLQLRGRIDGLFDGPGVLDEIKTHRGPLARVPANHRALHWAQLRSYGALWGREQGRERLTLRLCYYDLDRREEQQETVEVAVDTLLAELTARVRHYKAWLAGERAHVQRRDTLIDALDFPHAEVHEGQARLMRACERALHRGERLLVQAPTGVGKTLGVLFPALKALAAGHVDRLHYLTARNAVQAEVDAALDGLARDGRPLPLRVLTLQARERACVYPDRACHGESCPRARGFYDRLPAAREAARHTARLDAAALRGLAEAHQVCPYFLGQEMARWADLVVGDVNYQFDTHALLHALVEQSGARLGLLIDEAHNLIDRAREMYSLGLDQGEIRRQGAEAERGVRAALGALDRTLDDIASLAETRGEAEAPVMPEAPPRSLRQTLSRAIARLGASFAEAPSRAHGPVLELYFKLLGLQRLIERYGPHALCEVSREAPSAEDLLQQPVARFAVLNVVPAPHLRERFAAAHAVIAFSATLSPPDYHRALLGLPEHSGWLDLPSRFDPAQLEVRCLRHIPTTWRQRQASARAVADALAEAYRAAPGNYLAYCSSFGYLAQVAAALARHHPDIPSRRQQPEMGAEARAGFLASFTEHSRQIGFAVLGGSFAEGINLPGRRLVGAFICNLGLTPYTPRHRRMAAVIDTLFGPGRGEAYLHLYPAITRVVQAAGRIVRSPEDRGRLWLIDQRFSQPAVRALLPASWGLSGAAGARPVGPMAPSTDRFRLESPKP